MHEKCVFRALFIQFRDSLFYGAGRGQIILAVFRPPKTTIVYFH